MAKNTTHSVVVEGPEIICRAIDDLLKESMQVVGLAHGPSEAREMVKEHKPCLLIKEVVRNAEISGEEIKQLREDFPRTNLALLSDNPTARKAREAIQAGAKAYLGLEEECETIRQGLESAARGEAYVTAKLAAQILQEDTMGSPSRLTPREMEVLKETALGYTSTETGERLYMSKRTVESHRANINYKLGFHNRAQLVDYALHQGIIP